MIDEKATFKKFKYYSSALKPQSHKHILAVCDDCGKLRETSKEHYHALCKSCARKGKNNPNFGVEMSEEQKALISAAMKDRIFTEEWKAKISTARKGIIFTEEHKANISAAKKGDKHWNWQGGISFEPYCVKSNEAYKQLIRNKFDNRCFWCSMSREYNGRELDVHHVNYNKQCGCDNTKCICVPLCIRCHMKSNHDRDFWEEKIMRKLELSGILIED